MSHPLQGTRVLIVEDDSIIAMTAEDMLEEIGCSTVAIAATVAEALDHVASTAFEIALLDLNLRDEQSLPVAAALRDKGMPFIFATGYDGLPHGSGFEGSLVISKPYRIDQLATIVAQALAG